MAKKDLDWGNIGFGYRTTDYRYVANYKDGQWQEGFLTEDATVTVNECAGILQYCQEVFEGLKAYTTEDTIGLSMIYLLLRYSNQYL